MAEGLDGTPDSVATGDAQLAIALKPCGSRPKLEGGGWNYLPIFAGDGIDVAIKGAEKLKGLGGFIRENEVDFVGLELIAD